nr:class I SAM-dependent methyltransferase [Pseudomonadota bacterium]
MTVAAARIAAALDYLDRLDSIEGWLSPTTALAIIETLWMQERAGIAGDLAEIGVYRGKSFLALAAGARAGERLFAIDLFDAGDSAAERADYDVAAYGSGNRAVFLSNLARFFPAARVEVIEGSSRRLRGTEAATGLAGLRMISIDGGHTRALTENDLHIADAVLGPYGVCWLDDVLNPHWTGVVSGLFAFLATAPGLVPVALVPNKLALCRPAACAFYRDGFRSRFGLALEREGIELQDGTIDVFGDRWPEVSAPLRSPTDAPGDAPMDTRAAPPTAE